MEELWWKVVDDGTGYPKVVYMEFGKNFLAGEIVEKLNLSLEETVKETYVAHGPGSAWYQPEGVDQWLGLGSIDPATHAEEVFQKFQESHEQLVQFMKSFSGAPTTRFYTPTVWERMREILPQESLKTLVPCPGGEVWGYPVQDEENDEGCGWEDSVWNMIQHLNDDHKWGRERIADWLDTLDLDLEFRLPEED